MARQIFTDIVKSLLPQSCDKTAYSLHSSEIGAATCTAEKETPAWFIKALGRWSSNCFQNYIRVSSNTIDKIPSVLA